MVIDVFSLFPEWFSWFFEQVQRTHWPARTFCNEQWQLTWYEWRPDSSMAAAFEEK